MFAALVAISLQSLAQADLKKLDQHFESSLTTWGVPGYAVAIVKDGKIVFEKGYGILENGGKAEVDQHSLFAIASNTKAFISSSIATLVDDGKMTWDDKVKDHLPYFKMYNNYVTEETTIRDVLSHRTGLGTYNGDVFWYKSNYTPEETVRAAGRLQPAYSYRAGYGYSNLMFITGGEVIKAVSGQPWDTFVKEKFHGPLEMTRTQTSTSDLTSLNNVASPHKNIDGVHTPIAWTNWDNMGAAGGIISSVHDMGLWLKMHLNKGINGSDTLISRLNQSITWQPHNSFRVSDRTREIFPGRNYAGYGLGWSLSEHQGKKIVAHGGGYDGMYSRVVMVPEENLGIVILTNAMTGIGSWLAYDIVEAYLGNVTKDWSEYGLAGQKRGDDRFQKRIEDRKSARIEGTKPLHELGDLTGTFNSEFYGEIMVEEVNDKLRLSFPRAKDLNAELTHWHHDTYQIVWDQVHAWFSFGTVQFTSDNQGKINGIKFDVPNDDIFFEEIELVKIK